MHPRPTTADAIADRYSALLDLGRVLTGLIRQDDLYRAIADRAADALGAEAVIVSGFDAGTDQAAVAFVSGAKKSAGQTSYRGSECLAIRESRSVAHLPGDPAAACAALGLDSRSRPALVAPILREGYVLGTVTALGRAGTVYDAADLEFLTGIANLVTARAVPSAEPAAADSARFAEINRAIASVSLAEALEQIVRASAEASGADAVTVWLLRSGGDVEAAQSVGVLAPRKGTTFSLSHGLFRGLAERRDPVILDETTLLDPAIAEFRPLVAGKSSVVMPLVAEARVLGALAVSFRAGNAAARSVLPAIERLAELAAIATGYARLHEQIHALSLIDPLTGLANRRHLAMFLEKEFAAARRGRRLTVLFLDIDGFAEYNRKAGRPAGDAALRAFAEVIASQTRAMNLAARFGGDEFVVALADADRRAGFIHASRIAKAMSAHPLIAATQLHISVGIASFSPRMASFDDLLRGAQTDLDVRRKGGGRLTI